MDKIKIIKRNWRLDVELPPMSGGGDGDDDAPSQPGSQSGSGQSSGAKAPAKTKGSGGSGRPAKAQQKAEPVKAEKPTKEGPAKGKPEKKAEKPAPPKPEPKPEPKKFDEAFSQREMNQARKPTPEEQGREYEPGGEDDEWEYEDTPDLTPHLEEIENKFKVTTKGVGRAFDLNSAYKGDERLIRLASAFSLMIGKVAEDKTGDPRPGDDFYDIPRLASRRLNKDPLSSFLMTQDRERVVLLLDSSPSCKHLSDFYAKIARVAQERGDVEVYDAPNGMIQGRLIRGELHSLFTGKKMNPGDERGIGYNTVLEPGNKERTIDGWRKLFYHRTIILFSDFDAIEPASVSSRYNKIWYLCNVPTDDTMALSYWKRSLTEWGWKGNEPWQEFYIRKTPENPQFEGFTGKVLVDVVNEDDLVRVARAIRA